MGRHRKIEGLPSFGDFSSVTVACEALGMSASLGSLAVPSGWPTGTATTEAAPAADAASRPKWLTFQEGLMDVMTGSGTPSHGEAADVDGP
ncbi:hypothetical protein BN1232_02354 [Mycobacterium rhizamassiliense]|jgi:hypothetical protein|uniref:Uncharacterized protein n=1 Tax=Mycobacterium rhizamassiliense TaxID=1841860 RepID=A0A2U3NX71_9MYCO|nr:hypothetical protein [Mycobacterium rhizamassiliense]SPM36084.1 hypothetical protein BN1232_02354 [Mycobacterium rhizamassiliense]